MTCDELRRDAGGLAALDEGEQERAAAFEHARDCPGCAAALREGERLVALLEALPPEPAPQSAALRRAATPILDELPRAPAGRVLALSAAVTAVLVAVASRSHSDMARDWLAAGALAAGAAGIAALAGRVSAVPIVAVALSFLFAVSGGGGGPLSLDEGIRCAAVELATGAVLLVAAIAIWRREPASPGRLAGAAAAGALAGQAGLEIACHAPDATAHLVVFHFGAVIAAALVGALVSLGAARPAQPA
jgi:hypothetical protein